MDSIEKRRTGAVEQLRELAQIRSGLWRKQFLPSPDFDAEEAVRLNNERGLRAGVLCMTLSNIHPRAQFAGNNGRLTAGMEAGYDLEILG